MEDASGFGFGAFSNAWQQQYPINITPLSDMQAGDICKKHQLLIN